MEKKEEKRGGGEGVGRERTEKKNDEQRKTREMEREKRKVGREGGRVKRERKENNKG